MFSKWGTLAVLLMFYSWMWAQDKGLEHFNRQEFDQAREYYETLIKKGQQSPETEFGLGASAYKQKDYETAKAAFEKALATADKDLRAKAYYNMGNTLYQAQRREESLAFYRKALELNPQDKDAKYNYELVKYNSPSPQQKQGGGGKDDQKDQQKKAQDQQKNQPQNRSQSEKDEKNEEQNQPSPQDKPQKEKPREAGEQEEQQSGSERKQDTKPQSADRRQAESILNALKQDEKILQKRQIAYAKSRKLEKDW